MHQARKAGVAKVSIFASFYDFCIVFLNCCDSFVFLNCSYSVVFLNCSYSVVFFNGSESVVFLNCSDSVVFLVFILLLNCINIIRYD